MSGRTTALACTILGAIVIAGCNPNPSSVAGARELRLSLAPGSTSIQPTTVALHNVTTGETTRSPYQEGTMSFPVETDETYMVSFIGDSSGGSGSARGLGDAIQSLGTVEIAAVGIQSVPLGEGGEGDVDLGAVEESDDGYDSGMTSDETSLATGYDEETLYGYGAFDPALAKFTNPDIDGNGVYDDEQGLTWTIFVNQGFDAGELAPDFSSGSFGTAPADILPNLAFCLFEFGQGYTVPPEGTEIRLEVRDETGSVTTLTNPQSAYGTAFAGETSGQHIFSFWGDSGLPAYLEGDYTLLDGNSYTVRDVSFARPDSAYEGFVFMLVSLVADQTGLLTEYRWKWIQVKNGTYQPATTDQVSLMFQHATVGFTAWDETEGREIDYWIEQAGEEWFLHPPGDTADGAWSRGELIPGDPWYQVTGSIPLSGYNVGISSVTQVGNDWFDRAQNGFGINYATVDVLPILTEP